MLWALLCLLSGRKNAARVVRVMLMAEIRPPRVEIWRVAIVDGSIDKQ